MAGGMLARASDIPCKRSALTDRITSLSCERKGTTSRQSYSHATDLFSIGESRVY